MGTPKKGGKSQSTAAKGKRALTKAAKQAKFLEFYSKCGIVGWAAKQARINRKQHHEWLEEPEYAERFAAAHQEANDAVEREIWRRGHEGVLEPVWYQGKKAGTVRKHSDTLLIFYAKGQMPDKYRDNFKAEIDVKGTLNTRQTIDLSLLTDEQFEHLGSIHKALTGVVGDATSVSGGSPEAGEEQDPEVLPE